ncbi:hypothetical protein ACFO6W_11990 [Dysgonomonas termitidis]|uniref:O-antigen polysaccharide polymerase Wzy n=2 Tax=Dysgonomonas termitidis TaxID=1516126 RepID=A0ABV9KWJ5_9BACT
MAKIHSLDIVRRRFLYYQFFFIVLAFTFFYAFNLNGSAIFLLFLSCWNCVSYAYLFYKEIKLAPYFHPFIIFPLVVIQYIGFNGINLYFNMVEKIPIFFGIYEISPYITQGALFLSLEHFLIFLGYFYYDRIKMKYSEDYETDYTNISSQEVPYMKWAVIIYIIVWLTRILYGILPLSSISSIFSLVYTQGQLVPLTLLVFLMLKNDTNRNVKRLFWLITVIEIVCVLGYGMKESILHNILPYIIYLIAGYKSGKIPLDTKLLTKLGLLFVFIVFIVFPYINIFREIADRKHISWNEVTVEETIFEYIDYVTGKGLYSNENQTTDKGLEYALSRAGSIVCNAWSIHYAQENGLQPQYFYYCATAIVPRVLWPNKPPVAIGGMMYKLATGHNDWEISGAKSHVAVTIGFIGGCYFSFGIIGTLIFPFIAGLFVCWFWHFLRPRVPFDPIAIWAFYTIIKTIFKDFENFTDGGFVFFIWSLVYVFLIKYISPFNKYKKYL